MKVVGKIMKIVVLHVLFDLQLSTSGLMGITKFK
jgi:hypothetical protein